MVDREKVIRGLTVCSEFTPVEDCRKCPYQGEEYCTDAVMLDALALLREQEPDCRVCGQSSCRYYHETRKPKECGSYVRYEPDSEGR